MPLSVSWGSVVTADAALTTIVDAPQYFVFGGSQWIGPIDPFLDLVLLRCSVTFSGGDRDLELLVFNTLDDGPAPTSNLAATVVHRITRALPTGIDGPPVANLYRFRVGVRRSPTGGSVAIGSATLSYRVASLA